MKNKLITRFLITVASILSLALSAANTFAITNSTAVVSPFWQSDGNVYTFVAVTHTSLQTMSSSIGVIVSALKTDGSSFGSTSFTVAQNSTSRLFIVATNHSTINTSTLTSSSDLFIVGTTNLSSGSLRLTPSASNPRTGLLQKTSQTRDVTMLSFWGSVVIPGTNTGFAMEFIGDTHDSVFNIMSRATRVAVGVH